MQPSTYSIAAPHSHFKSHATNVKHAPRQAPRGPSHLSHTPSTSTHTHTTQKTSLSTPVPASLAMPTRTQRRHATSGLGPPLPPLPQHTARSHLLKHRRGCRHERRARTQPHKRLVGQ
eukprot:356531-Chlamydomonas_euryale.AAC.3